MLACFSLYQPSGCSADAKEGIFFEQALSGKLWSTSGITTRGSKKSSKGQSKVIYVLSWTACTVVILPLFVFFFNLMLHGYFLVSSKNELMFYYFQSFNVLFIFKLLSSLILSRFCWAITMFLLRLLVLEKFLNW